MFKYSFNAKTASWNIVMVSMWGLLQRKVCNIPSITRDSAPKHLEFPSLEEAQKYAKETGLDQIYEDVSLGMPWDKPKREWYVTSRLPYLVRKEVTQSADEKPDTWS